MLRRLFTIVSATSLLLSVATCIMWIRSYGVAEIFGFNCDLRLKPSFIDANGTLWTGSCRFRSTELGSERGAFAIASAYVSDVGHVEAWRLFHRTSSWSSRPEPVFSLSAPTFGGRWSFEVHSRYSLLFIITLICPMLWIILARRASIKLRPGFEIASATSRHHADVT